MPLGVEIDTSITLADLRASVEGLLTWTRTDIDNEPGAGQCRCLG